MDIGVSCRIVRAQGDFERALSKGFEAAGFELALAVEKWQPARVVYEKNFDHPVKDLDLADLIDAVAGVKKEKPEIIIGGPPCQDFSAAGERIESHRARLTVSYAEIIRAVRPTWFLMENVMEARKSVSWLSARRLLSNAGYGITECVLNAAYYGVPQNRKRFFAVGRLEEDDDFLLDDLLDGAADAPMTVREFVKDEFDFDYYYRHPRTWERRAIYSVDEPSATIRSTNRPVPPSYQRHPGDAAPPKEVRSLTPEQRARIQTFGKTFKFLGSAAQKDIMIANAVPVKLARHVAKAIKRFEDARAMTPGDRTFRSWLTDTQHYTPRTAGNVISRFKRANRILQSTRMPIDPLDAIHALERRREYATLTSAVRSQIKKAVRLHAEFKGRDK
ncbi:MAG: DNA cytosine methyltransferase [Luteimonas sp.]